MITEKQKQNEEMFKRDGAGRFIKIQDDEENKLNRPLTDREKQMIENFKKKDKK